MRIHPSKCGGSSITVHQTKSIRLIGTIFLVAIFLSGCVRLGGAVPTVKIGLIAPFEGLHRSLGYQVLFAVKLAIQERNQGQGLQGYRVELVALNDNDDPATAAIQAQALVADPDILGVVGHLSSKPTLAAWPIYQQEHLAISIPWTVATDQIPGKGWIAVAASERETLARLETIRKTLNVQNVAYITDSQFDIHTLSPETEAIQLAVEGVAAGEIISTLQAADRSLPVLGQVEVGMAPLLQVAHQAANGLIFVSPGANPQHYPTNKAEVSAFIENYQTLAGFPPGPRATLAYDATNILLDAIEMAMLQNNNQRPSRAQVSQIINQVQRMGISGPLAFKKSGQRLEAPVWVYQILDENYPGALFAP